VLDESKSATHAGAIGITSISLLASGVVSANGATVVRFILLLLV